MSDDLAELRVEIDFLREELLAYEASSEIRRAADQRAIERWQKDTGKTHVWPDHTDLCVWLMRQWDERKTLAEDIAAQNELFFLSKSLGAEQSSSGRKHCDEVLDAYRKCRSMEALVRQKHECNRLHTETQHD